MDEKLQNEGWTAVSKYESPYIWHSLWRMHSREKRLKTILSALNNTPDSHTVAHMRFDEFKLIKNEQTSNQNRVVCSPIGAPPLNCVGKCQMCGCRYKCGLKWMKMNRLSTKSGYCVPQSVLPSPACRLYYETGTSNHRDRNSDVVESTPHTLSVSLYGVNKSIRWRGWQGLVDGLIRTFC